MLIGDFLDAVACHKDIDPLLLTCFIPFVYLKGLSMVSIFLSNLEPLLFFLKGSICMLHLWRRKKIQQFGVGGSLSLSDHKDRKLYFL